MHSKIPLSALLVILCAANANPQTPLSQTPETTPQMPQVLNSSDAVPRLVRITGSIAVPQSAASSADTSAAANLPAKNRSGNKVELTFSIYSQQTGGEPLWTEQQTLRLDTAGHYSVFLGAATPSGLPVDVFSTGEARWLGIRAADAAEPPRTLLVSVPYALKAHDAETLSGHAASDFVTPEMLHAALHASAPASSPAATQPATTQSPIRYATPTGSGTTNYVPLWTSPTGLGNSVLYQSGTHIGIGTVKPYSPLEVDITHAGQTTLFKLGNLLGKIGSTADIDLSVNKYSSGSVRLGALRTDYQYANDADLVFSTTSNTTLKEAMRVTSYGWVGVGTTSPHALIEADAPTVTSGFGAYAITGVGGTATGAGIGGGIGVTGYGGGGTGYFQYADGAGGSFIGGNAAHEGDGIVAIAGSGYAGYFSGNVAASGTFTAGVVNNNIDDPISPATQVLSHSLIGSSEMLNLYSGNVTTNADGEATVQMPAWFEAYNADFRYQLTAIGQFAQVIVSRRLANNQFRIRSSVPNLEVSWQISAVRSDAYAKAHPLAVEQAKDPAQQGFYLHPELYGADEEHQLAWTRHPALMKSAKAHREQQRVSAANALHVPAPK